MLLVCGLVFAACGSKQVGQSMSEQPSVTEEAAAEPTTTPKPEEELTWQDTVKVDGTTDIDKWNAYIGLDLSKLETKIKSMEDVPDNIIVIGAMTYDYEHIYDIVVGFNKSQDAYKADGRWTIILR